MGKDLILTGCARTGTTALVKLLSKQPSIMITNEFGTYNDWERQDKWTAFANFREDAKFLKENREIFGFKNLDFDSIRKLIIDRKMSTQDIFAWVRNNIDAEYFGDKCPMSYLKNLRLFDRKFPDHKFIITVRDGRDVIASQIRNYNKYGWAYAGWMKPTVEEAMPLWLEASLLIRDVVRTIDSSKILLFRYEDAVEHVDDFCEVLTEFIGCTEITNIDNVFKATNVSVWKQEHPEMMSVLTDDFKNMLSKFGYDV
jgi:hypothetical protein